MARFYRCAVLITLFAGCSRVEEDGDALTVWFHSGRQAERETIQDQIQRFNASQDDFEVKLTIVPEGAYNSQVQAAALADDLPDVLEFDGPFLYNYVWKGRLIPLDDLLSEELQERLLPSIVEQGTHRDRLYSVGTFDSGLGLYARRSKLEGIDARLPASPGEAWSVEQFRDLLAKLAENDEDGAVLDLKLNYRGEWYTYAFSPAIQSAGGDLVDRSDYQSAEGVLNGPEAVSAMQEIQSWITENYVDPNIDDAAFTEGRVALSWSGHWDYPRYADKVGDDLVLLPLPDFGQGTRTGQGSWSWGVTTSCERPEAAARFLEFLLQDEEVLAMAGANGAPPATTGAIAQSDLYAEDGPLRLFIVQLQGGQSVPRPRTPAYPVITSAFQDAFAQIRDGGDVQAALDKAVKIIDQDIQDNQGYPPGYPLAGAH